MPVLAKPADLSRVGSTVVQRRPDGTTGPYADRAAIEAAAAAGSPSAPVLAWMRAEDLFFLQIQGSGYLTFEDGSSMRAAYAADNGRPFAGIARPMEASRACCRRTEPRATPFAAGWPTIAGARRGPSRR